MMSEMKILDCGYIKLIEHWGSDERIIESARMSTGKGFNGWGPMCPECGSNAPRVDDFARDNRCMGCGVAGDPVVGDEKLLKFLWDNKHATPFEMAGVTVEVKAPIMVFREWHRHRVPFGYNEMSARYTPLPNENYLPTVERLMVGGDGRNKQAGTIAGAGVLTVDGALKWLADLADVYEHAERVYNDGLQIGVPKELARLPVPVARYSRMRATGNLRGWLGLLSLRSTLKNPAAQYEFRVYADALIDMLDGVFPRVLSLFKGCSS
jgi:thymidylate synthase (FAD)